MNNFTVRTLTGAIFVAALATGIYLSYISFFILFLGILILALHEFYRLSEKTGATPNKTWGIIAATYIFSSFFLERSGVLPAKVTLGLIPLVFFIFIAELYRKKENPFQNIAFTILGLVIVGLPITLFNFFVFPDYSKGEYFPYFLFGLFIIQWASDTGAYVFGVSFGKHRLFERISPKKSWEGSIGGTATALGTAWLLSRVIPEVELIHWLVVGVITVVMGTFGDLVESLYKRSIDVKDSGSILPGHGGMLDRFDSIFFAAPAVFVYLKLALG
ncbi:phosphatidate cytidylyltransferase [Prolixibacteraceae bacterium JC049]|nr:phosphatidate cytidylyltransferase [Prolixibacteraceae bacterium JC049]